MDDTYIKVAGKWMYLYRAVDRAGGTVDFLLTAKRDKAAARRFLERAINLHGVSETITIDKTSANAAAIESVKADACVDLVMRQKNTRTTSWSKITKPSKESPNRCLGSSRSGVPES